MPKHTIIAGAVSYVDADGLERWAFNGQEIDFTKSEAARLMAAGHLHDQAAADRAAEAEEAALQARRDIEDRQRQDEAERLAGEAAAKAAADNGADDDAPPKGQTVAMLEDALRAAGIDQGDATTRKELWAKLPEDARAGLV